MKFSKLLTIFIFVLTTLIARTWTVDQRSGANFSTLSAAVASASVLNGDTLLVAGAAGDYAGFTLNKKLTIYGPGYFLNENGTNQANLLTAKITGTITINAGASGSILMGLHFRNYMYINEDNITLSRNYFEVSTSYYGVYVYANVDNLKLTQNYMKNAINNYSIIYFTSTNITNVNVANNYIANTFSGGPAIDCSSSPVTGIIQNNVIIGSIQLHTISFNNNIWISGANNGFTSVSPYHNICNSTQLSTFSSGPYNNQNSINMTGIFLAAGGSTDGQYQLNVAGVAKGTGFGGVDCGMFDNSINSAYVLSGIPNIPSIYSFSANADLSNITIKIKSNN